MKVLSAQIWPCLCPALTLAGLFLCATLARAQVTALDLTPSPSQENAPGTWGMSVPEVHQVDGEPDVVHSANQMLIDEPWSESSPDSGFALPLLDSEFQPEVILVPDPLDLAQEPWWADHPSTRDHRQWQFPVLRLLRWMTATRHAYPDEGIGYERVVMAPFILDIARPMNQTALRTDLVYGWTLPDRSEAFWARTINGRGPPLPERSVRYQDIAYLTEIGSPGFSVRTVVPLRILDPENNAKTTGMGDMQLLTKTVLLNGSKWTLTQVNDVWFSTGAPGKGLGKGHTTMAPGLLAAYQRSDTTCLHGQFKFQFPLGGDPNFAGELLHWGIGASHLWYDSDAFAIIPTIEMSFVSFLTGRATQYPEPLDAAPLTPRVDGETISTMHFGVRTVHDTGRDWGLVELGVSGGFQWGHNGWYDSMMRLEFRLVY
jgi:hypothetical protein